MRVVCDALGNMVVEDDKRHGHFNTIVVWNRNNACIGDLAYAQQAPL